MRRLAILSLPLILFAAGAAAQSGGLGVPVDGAITSHYGPRGGHNHHGIDIGADTGTPIYAAADGVVGYAQSGCSVGAQKCGGGFGNFVRLDHGSGTQTISAHMSQLAPGLSTGSQVKAGDLIGYVGNTGHSTGPHLHFETIQNGQSVDPRSLIAGLNRNVGSTVRETVTAGSPANQINMSGDPANLGPATPMTAGGGTGGDLADCEPTVLEAMQQQGQNHSQGRMERKVAVAQAPQSVFDLSCFESIMDQMRDGFSFQARYDPVGIINLLMNQAMIRVCGAAQQAWNQAVGRILDVNQVFEPLQQIPGLRVGVVQGGTSSVSTTLSGSIIDQTFNPPEVQQVIIKAAEPATGGQTAPARKSSPSLFDLFR